MIDTNPTDPGMDRKGARQFFYSFFYADFLQDQKSIQEAVQEYLEDGTDPKGALLLAETDELLNSGMSEDELKNLIEKTWHADVDSTMFGFMYKDVLGQMVTLLGSKSKIK